MNKLPEDEYDIIMETLLNLMRRNSIATGHGDTIMELIATINASIIDLRAELQTLRKTK